ACASTQSVGSEVINVGLTGTQAFWVGIEVQPERYPPVYCEDEVTFVAHPSHPATIYWYKGEQQVATGNTYDPVTFDASDVLTVKAYAAANPCLQNDFAETTLNEFFSIEDPVGEVTVNVLGPPYRCTGTGQSNFFAVADNSKNISWSIIPL